jgi:CcmD family protein
MDVTLKDLIAEIRNLSFLFYGYSVVWVLVVGYIYSLTRREKNLRDQIDELKKEIESEKK